MDAIPACTVCHVWPGHDIPAHVAAVKADVQAGIADGTFPTSIRTFSELHDYCDANMMDGLGDSLCGGEGSDDECVQQALCDTFNLVTDEVSAWLAAGRTDAPLTPEVRMRALITYMAHGDPEVLVLTDPVHGTPPGGALFLTDANTVSVVATPEGWLIDGIVATSRNGRPYAPGDIYLVGWDVLKRIGSEYIPYPDPS